jgi:hypothetical protein
MTQSEIGGARKVAVTVGEAWERRPEGKRREVDLPGRFRSLGLGVDAGGMEACRLTCALYHIQS